MLTTLVDNNKSVEYTAAGMEMKIFDHNKAEANSEMYD